MGADHQHNCTCRTKKVTEDLYECHSEDVSCRYRFLFGGGHFCEWLLDKLSRHSEHKLPCCKKEDTGKTP
jgi:hypothetical protein